MMADVDIGSLAARLAGVGTCMAMDILRDHNPDALVMRDVRPLLPVSRPVVGRARTLRFLPRRPDNPRATTSGANRQLIDNAGSGEILVFDTSRGLGGSVLGDMLAWRAVARGVAAVVTDGHMRDMAGIAETGLPIFGTGVWPVSNAASLIAWDIDMAVQCGGVLVLPGDLIIADSDGVILLPVPLAEMVAAAAPARSRDEEKSRELLQAGHPLEGAYPLVQQGSA